MAYKIGYCPQCKAQIMVRDAAGRWNSQKTNYSQIDLVFEDGLKVRTAICKDCAANPDYEKLFEEIVASGSQAGTKKTRDKIKFKKDESERGFPVSHELKQMNRI